ncbi:Box C/D snoRNA protein 1 [Mortierella alpina]|uniref:Box C/D snoRNA protein 1 n=1 Tax=Mortierella alpina TaxID=64518 RepID=A0A9P6JBQ7_MORAP|nr:Box C/D snoRNA protein 1 [Mortierella alpina]
MDFFANAFVTRDKVDESNVVVKDGIQIRENVVAASSDVVNCEVCGKVTAKYKCPGCFCQTCSLQCSKQHKLDTTCSGVRSRIHFVERKQYSEQDMMSDYNFLEEVGRTVDNAARENVKLDAGLNPNRKRILGANHQNKNNKRMQNNRRQSQQDASAEAAVSGPGSVTELALTAAQELEKQGAEGSGSYRDKQLILQAKKRGTHLIMMADGLKKRKENNTHWRDKPSRFLWTIEWLFPEMETSRRILEHKNEESKTLKDILAGTLAKPENSDVAGKYPLEQLDQCRFYFVIPLRHANQPALYPLKVTNRIQEALQFKKVLEYPTIIVVGPSTASEASFSGTIESGSEQAGGAEALPSVLAKSSETAAEGEKPGKKIKVAAGDENKESSDASSDGSDSDSDSDSDDSSDDSDSDDSSDDVDDEDKKEDKADKDEEKAAAKAISGEEETNTRSGHTEEDVANASISAEQTNLELGQAILEAFNQDFGETETQQ